ncbi:MAG: DinB family protein [Spirochaetia bacterium]|nr:DinB family protein [Spirochaetia bacterium]
MKVTDGKEFAAYMRTVRKRTLDVIGLVPQDRVGWRLTEDSMSVIDIALHIASVEKALWGEGLKDFKADALDEFAKDSMSMSGALDYMRQVRIHSDSFWSGLSQDDLQKLVTTPTGDTSPLNRWLVLAAEHEIHHRGYVHAYRKIWGLSSSPIYGLTFEDLQRLLRGIG